MGGRGWHKASQRSAQTRLETVHGATKKQNKKSGNARKHQKSSFFDKMATFCMPLSRFSSPIPIPTPAATMGDRGYGNLGTC